MGNILQFDRGRGRTRPQGPPPQPAGAAANKVIHDNQHTRRSFIAMFLMGASVRKVGRTHPAGEPGLEQDLRETILGDNPAQARRAA